MKSVRDHLIVFIEVPIVFLYRFEINCGLSRHQVVVLLSSHVAFYQGQIRVGQLLDHTPDH
jgi:hypothetical protein